MENNKIKIGEHIVGNDKKTFIVAEVAQAHDGSLGLAHSYIDLARDAGADAVKFQTHIANAESTQGEPFRVKFSKQDKSRYDYWKRMEFSLEQWKGLYDHAIEVGLVFLSSPFSVEAVELLEEINVLAWKVGSGEINNPQLLEAMARTQKPIILSSGMNAWNEIEQAVVNIRKLNVPLALMQCTSKYPTSLEEVGLNVIDEMRSRFDLPVGLSDHSGTVFPALAALAKGVALIEVHLVLRKGIFGPDTSASLSPEELKLICDARDAFHIMNTNAIDKDVMAQQLESMRKLFNKSVALKKSQSAGTALTLDMLTVKKPGTGIPAQDLEQCVGRKLNSSITSDRVLKWDDLED